MLSQCVQILLTPLRRQIVHQFQEDLSCSVVRLLPGCRGRRELYHYQAWKRSTFRSLAFCARRFFLREVFQSIRPAEEIKPTEVFEDNQGAIMLPEKPLSSARTKHIVVGCHHIRTQCADRVIELIHVASSEQHGDMLTKPLGAPAFEYHCEVVMGMK